MGLIVGDYFRRDGGVVSQEASTKPGYPATSLSTTKTATSEMDQSINAFVLRGDLKWCDPWSKCLLRKDNPCELFFFVG